MKGAGRVRKISICFTAMLMVSLHAAISISAEVQKGIIKSVDTKTGTVVFMSTNGQDVTLTPDKSLELNTIKAGDKVEISVENNMLKSIKEDHSNWCPKDF
jgi:hypothetical protein